MAGKVSRSFISLGSIRCFCQSIPECFSLRDVQYTDIPKISVLNSIFACQCDCFSCTETVTLTSVSWGFSGVMVRPLAFPLQDSEFDPQ